MIYLLTTGGQTEKYYSSVQSYAELFRFQHFKTLKKYFYSNFTNGTSIAFMIPPILLSVLQINVYFNGNFRKKKDVAQTVLSRHREQC